MKNVSTSSDLTRQDLDKMKMYLNDVLDNSEKSALSTIQYIEDCNKLINEIKQKYQTRLHEINTSSAKQSMYQDPTAGYLNDIHYSLEHLQHLSNILLNIMMTQSTQDLSGQKIQKCSNIVHKIEDTLLSGDQKIELQEAPPPQETLSDQSNVDDLFSSFSDDDT